MRPDDHMIHSRRSDRAGTRHPPADRHPRAPDSGRAERLRVPAL